MAAPVYLNAGTRTTTTTTSVTPALPASRVNGNILICMCGTKGGNAHTISGSGWQQLGSQGLSGTFRGSLWWRVVDGTEASPTISWGGASIIQGTQILQFTRENFDKVSPFGTIQTPATGSTSTHTSTGYNTTRNNSLALYFDLCSSNTALATPAGWNERVDNGNIALSLRNTMGDKTVTTSGTGTGNISVTGGAAAWIQWQLELLEPLISGTMAATDSGSDTAAMSGTVAVSGTLAATETGADTMSATGTVTAGEITGTMAAQETGNDTFAGSGTVAVTGALAATETGDDTFAGSGQVAVSGSLDATDAGDDTFAGTGSVAVSGTLAAQEVGDDTFEGTGQVAISGSLEAQEAGDDVFAGAGTVTDAGGPVTGSMAAVETGEDTFAGSGTVEAVQPEVTSRGGIELTLPPGTKRKKPKSINSQLEEAVRRALGRFPGKRSKPPITSERLQEAAEAILNMPDIPQWEFERVATVLRDILGQVGEMATPQDMIEVLLELADDVSIDEDDEELIELLMTYEVEYIMSL